MVEKINDKMASLVGTIKDLVRVMSEVPQPSPPPVPAGKGAETEEKGGGEGGKSGKS